VDLKLKSVKPILINKASQIRVKSSLLHSLTCSFVGSWPCCRLVVLASVSSWRYPVGPFHFLLSVAALFSLGLRYSLLPLCNSEAQTIDNIIMHLMFPIQNNFSVWQSFTRCYLSDLPDFFTLISSTSLWSLAWIPTAIERSKVCSSSPICKWINRIQFGSLNCSVFQVLHPLNLWQHFQTWRDCYAMHPFPELDIQFILFQNCLNFLEDCQLRSILWSHFWLIVSGRSYLPLQTWTPNKHGVTLEPIEPLCLVKIKNLHDQLKHHIFVNLDPSVFLESKASSSRTSSKSLMGAKIN